MIQSKQLILQLDIRKTIRSSKLHDLGLLINFKSKKSNVEKTGYYILKNKKKTETSNRIGLSAGVEDRLTGPD